MTDTATQDREQIISAGNGLLAIIEKAQRIMVTYLVPDGIPAYEAISQMIELLDSEPQRVAEEYWAQAIGKATAMTNPQDREAFEAWYLKEHPHENIPGIFARYRSNDNYVQFLPQWAFRAWCAGSAEMAKEVAALEQDISTGTAAIVDLHDEISNIKAEINELTADLYELRNQ